MARSGRERRSSSGLESGGAAGCLRSNNWQFTSDSGAGTGWLPDGRSASAGVPHSDEGGVATRLVTNDQRTGGARSTGALHRSGTLVGASFLCERASRARAGLKYEVGRGREGERKGRERER